MKRVLLLFSLACIMIFPVALAQAAPVESWNVSISAKFTDIVMSDGTRIADSGDYFSWDNRASSFEWSAGGGQLKLDRYGDAYDAHFTGGLDRYMDDKQLLPVELKSLKLSYDIVLTPEGGAGSVSFSLDLPVCYYNIDPWGAGRLQPAILFNEGSYYATKQVVYNGMVYEFKLGSPCTTTGTGIMPLSRRRPPPSGITSAGKRIPFFMAMVMPPASTRSILAAP